MKYIASCSFGKDSLAMLLRILEENKPLDEVVFYDTGMEFQAIYNVKDKVYNLKELKNYYLHLPKYWEKLKELQSKTDRPMKYNKYTVYDLEDKFKEDN